MLPKNNLAEQLAIHKKALNASAERRGSHGRSSTFTPPHKPALSLSFSSTKFNTRPSLSKSTGDINTHDRLTYPSVPANSAPRPPSPPSSNGCATVRRPHVPANSTPRPPSPPNGCATARRPHALKHKPGPPVAFVAPVVSKGTQSIKHDLAQKCVSPLNASHSAHTSFLSLSPTTPHPRDSIQTPVPSQETSLPRDLTASVPGSSLAFCTLTTTCTDSKQFSPTVQNCSRAGLESELERVRNEKMSVMDDICDLLADIPPQDIRSLFRLSAGHVQKKLAMRKKLMLKEDNLKRCLETSTTSTPLTSLTGFSPSSVSSVLQPSPSPLAPPPRVTSAPEARITAAPLGVAAAPQAVQPLALQSPQRPAASPSTHQRDMFGDNFYTLEDDDWDFNMEEEILMMENMNKAPPLSSHSSVLAPISAPPTSHGPPATSYRDPPTTSHDSPSTTSHGPLVKTFHDPPFSSYDPPLNSGEVRSPNSFSSQSSDCIITSSTKPVHTKTTFEPPFKPGGRPRADMNASFGAACRRPGMFKASTSGTGNQPKDDAAEFRGQYQHTREMYKIFNQVFGLKKFRPNQLEAVNAAVLGKDCFVLMPTGGGKSLCYQLPALMSPGVTIVVSPLRSLIQDQVQKLTSLGIPAKHLSSDLSLDEEREVYASLCLREPVTKLLYVTPEKLGASNKLMSTLTGLHNRQMLARFVIDEAHCISQWGHDFRPDYKKLSELRGRFSRVPIMALTATATPRVRADILYQLKMERTCKWFTQSFNRTNLTYIVVPKKPKKAIQDIVDLINKSFQGLSGIVYCLSRRDCEIMAGELCKGNIAALCYHAGLSNEERSTVQQRWVQEDRCKVVCATIAFGMGIDKPDVRFVIHHSLPKSVEGYYQEAGRAGRDGKTAQCILFYNYSDMARLRRMVKFEKLSYEQEKVHMDNLYRMVQYCENMADCRRAQLLEYFAETFDPALCKNSSTPCDNCQSNVQFAKEDVTNLVKVVVRSVQQVGKDKYTLNQCLDALKGSGVSKIANGELGRLPLYGAGGAKTKHDLERLLHMLVRMDVLAESLTIGNHDNVVCYVKLGGKARDVLDGRITGITLKVKGSGKTTSGSNKATAKAVSKEDTLKEKCLKELTALRLTVTHKLKLQNPEYVVPSAALQAMVSQLPTSKADMLNVEGYTEIKWDKFEGESFLQITKSYAAEVARLSEGTEAATRLAATTSSYFKESAENKARPLIGKGKRKKASENKDTGNNTELPAAKRQSVLDFNGGYDSGEEFELPAKSKRPELESVAKPRRTPLKGLLPHPNNR